MDGPPLPTGEGAGGEAAGPGLIKSQDLTNL